MSALINGMSDLSEEAASAIQQLTVSVSPGFSVGQGSQGMTTLAECFKDWKDWFRDRPAIQARWDQRRMERATAKATGSARRQGRL